MFASKPQILPADPSQPQPALAGLTPLQQETIRLRKEGLSFAEIGECLGCTEAAALYFVRRASAKLKASVGGLPEPEAAETKAAVALASACGTRIVFRAAEA